MKDAIGGRDALLTCDNVKDQALLTKCNVALAQTVASQTRSDDRLEPLINWLGAPPGEGFERLGLLQNTEIVATLALRDVKALSYPLGRAVPQKVAHFIDVDPDPEALRRNSWRLGLSQCVTSLQHHELRLRGFDDGASFECVMLRWTLAL